MPKTIDLHHLAFVMGGATEMNYAVQLPGVSADLSQIDQLGSQVMQGMAQQSESVLQMFMEAFANHQAGQATPSQTPTATTTPPLSM
jgi:hypothetical protein